MTDNEIIKANACCANEGFQNCKYCPLYIEHQPCNKTLLPKITLDLLNRQKVEIDELRKENFELKDGYFQKRYEETEHQELMGLREAFRRADKERDYFQLKAMNLEEENKQLTQELTEHGCRRKD